MGQRDTGSKMEEGTGSKNGRHCLVWDKEKKKERENGGFAEKQLELFSVKREWGGFKVGNGNGK